MAEQNIQIALLQRFRSKCRAKPALGCKNKLDLVFDHRAGNRGQVFAAFIALVLCKHGVPVQHFADSPISAVCHALCILRDGIKQFAVLLSCSRSAIGAKAAPLRQVQQHTGKLLLRQRLIQSSRPQRIDIFKSTIKQSCQFRLCQQPFFQKHPANTLVAMPMPTKAAALAALFSSRRCKRGAVLGIFCSVKNSGAHIQNSAGSVLMVKRNGRPAYG